MAARGINWLPNFKAGIQVLTKLVVPSAAGNPGGVADGWLWVDTTAGKLAVRVAGSTVLVPLASEIGSSLTQEQVEDFVGAMFPDTSDMDWTYTDNGAGAGTLAVVLKAGTVTYAQIQNVSATSRILGRKTGGAGSVEELTASDVRTILGTLDADTLNGSSAATIQTNTINAIVAGAGAAWDTLLEIKAFIQTDETTAAALATTVAGKARFQANAVPNGASPQTINHALALGNKNDFIIDIKDASGNEVEYGIVATDANNISVIDDAGAAIPTGLRYFLVAGA